MYLAGGLAPENVKKAVEKVEPYAVDSCSLLESKKGVKDSTKVISFISKLR
jgi:phosphoribosylanthranilate isomerase